MATSDIGAITSDIYQRIKKLEPADQDKVLTAVSSLVDRAHPARNGDGQPQMAGQKAHDPRKADGKNQTEEEYFNSKDPKGHSEKIAVAAYYLEKFHDKEHWKSKEIKEVFTAARRPFPANFTRDMKNGIREDKFFIQQKRGYYRLSNDGVKVVEGLPNRDAAATSSRVLRRRKKNRTSKRKAH